MKKKFNHHWYNKTYKPRRDSMTKAQARRFRRDKLAKLFLMDP
jgi:hypothetical protein